MTKGRNPSWLQSPLGAGPLMDWCGRLALAFVAAGMACAPASSAENAYNAQATADAREVMEDLAACVVRGDHDVARRFVLTPLYEQVDRSTSKRVVDGNCMGFRAGRLKMTPNLYRAALAEQLVKTDLAAWPVIDPSNVPPIKWGKVKMPPANDPKSGKPFSAAQSAEFAKRFERISNEILVGQLGECVVRTDPAKALALLKTRINKPDEVEALKALLPVFSGCVQQGASVALDRTNMRSGVALSYYRIASSMMPTALAGAEP